MGPVFPTLYLPNPHQSSLRWGGHSHLTDVETESQMCQASPIEPQWYEEAAEGGSSQVSRALALLPLPRDVVKIPPADAGDTEMPVRFLSRKVPLEEGMATHSSILAWRIP